MVRKAFGGVQVSFKKVGHMLVDEVFGAKPISPAEMVKTLWALIKKHNLRVK